MKYKKLSIQASRNSLMFLFSSSFSFSQEPPTSCGSLTPIFEVSFGFGWNEILNYVKSYGLRRNAINGHHHFAKAKPNKKNSLHH